MSPTAARHAAAVIGGELIVVDWAGVQAARCPKRELMLLRLIAGRLGALGR
jgi:hypothetical protein